MSRSPGKTFAARVLRKLLWPLVPAKSKLSFRYWLADVEGSHEDELRLLHKFVPGKEVAIDVGANYGLFSYRLSSLYSKVYAFEINPGLTPDLVAYNPGNIEVIPKGLSSKAGKATLFTPLLNGQELHGWASLAPNNCPDTDQHVETEVEIVTLDSFALPAVSFMKMDVEGHEVEALKGAVETLKRCRPMVLVEVKDKNIETICKFFAELRYEQKRLKDLIGIEGSEENFIFVPK
jgi:FkbM family methyltransferase